MADPTFQAADLSTGFVDQRWDPTPLRAAAAAVAAERVARAYATDLSAPAIVRSDQARPGWRDTARREAVEGWPR
jgi:hypothetical protein